MTRWLCATAGLALIACGRPASVGEAVNPQSSHGAESSSVPVGVGAASERQGGARADSGAAASGATAAVTARRDALAAVYHAQRCVMTGEAVPLATRFVPIGGGDAASFEQAWLAEAALAPGWAAEVVASGLARPCVAVPVERAAEGR